MPRTNHSSAINAETPRPRCESGWTGDRCTYPLFHSGPHSNESRSGEQRSAQVWCDECDRPSVQSVEVSADGARYRKYLCVRHLHAFLYANAR